MFTPPPRSTRTDTPVPYTTRSPSPRACDARRALRTHHRDEQQRDLVAEAEVDADRLRDEQRRERHIDVRAVEIEAVAGRHDEADDRLGAAEIGRAHV